MYIYYLYNIDILPITGVHPSLLCPLQPATRMVGLPRTGANNQGVHARSNHNRSQMAGRVRAQFLQARRSHQAQQE